MLMTWQPHPLLMVHVALVHLIPLPEVPLLVMWRCLAMKLVSRCFLFVLLHCIDQPQSLSTMQDRMTTPAFTSVYSALTSSLALLESSLLALAPLWHTLSTLGVQVFPSMYHSMSNGLCYWALLEVRAELDDYMIQWRHDLPSVGWRPYAISLPISCYMIRIVCSYAVMLLCCRMLLVSYCLL